VVEEPRLLSGRYRLIEPIGRGGMSVVWRAHDQVLGRRVAVKLLTAELRDEGRLRAEAQAAALLSHPNVTAVYDFGVADGEPFVVMELVEGRPLADRLTEGALPWRGAVEVCAHVAAALSAAHARGLVHRDVTAANIMLTDSGVKVVDFGIAAIVGARADDELVGTPAYLAPERIAGEVGGPAVDVFALGVLLFVALTGRLPWPARNRAELLRRRGEPALLPPIPGMPLAVAEIYEACIVEDPAARPASAVIARRLADLAGVRVGAVDGATPQPRAYRPAKGGTLLLPDPPPEEPASAPADRRVSLRTALIGAAAAVVVGATAMAVVAFGPARSGDKAQAAGGSSPGSPTPVLSCDVAYQVVNKWQTGATVAVKITNASDADIRGWTLEFDLKGDVKAQSGWNGTWRQQGERVTVTAASHNADIRAGGTVDGVGTNLDGKDAGNRIPENFRLNGARCGTP
jgi:serine/threonine-protein kinase